VPLIDDGGWSGGGSVACGRLEAWGDAESWWLLTPALPLGALAGGRHHQRDDRDDHHQQRAAAEGHEPSPAREETVGVTVPGRRPVRPGFGLVRGVWGGRHGATLAATDEFPVEGQHMDRFQRYSSAAASVAAWCVDVR
jgi:hypothetical protein